MSYILLPTVEALILQGILKWPEELVFLSLSQHTDCPRKSMCDVTSLAVFQKLDSIVLGGSNLIDSCGQGIELTLTKILGE